MERFRRTAFTLAIIATITAVLFTACSGDMTKPGEGGNLKEASDTRYLDIINNKTFPMKITDFENRTVTIENSPERIVSLAPGITEVLFKLGAGDNVVGVTDYDDYPEEVFSIQKVGNFQGPNMEAIAAQRPDIILASTLSGKNSMEALQRLGTPVLVLEARNMDQIYESIDILSRIIEKPYRGVTLIADMKGKMADIQNRVSAYPRKRVFYIVDLNGNFTAGGGTFIDYLITLAGGENIAAQNKGWAQYSAEKVAEQNPEVIITAAHAGDMKNLSKLPGYKETDAVKENKVYIISDDNIISRTSHRIIQGLEEIATFLHPEAF